MVDAILYINLEYRKDRKDHILSQLEKLKDISTNVHRIDAVLNTECGHIGCGKSHIKALELAIENNWDSVLIVEDDLCIQGDIENIRKINDIKWDVMMLGYGHRTIQECEYPFLKRVTNACCTHGYIVRKHYYQTLLDNFKEAIPIMETQLEKHLVLHPNKKLIYCTAIDQHWKLLQKKDIFYAFDPVLGVQNRELKSDNF
jgi:GR25 family glycosyltransferase involved in LPS biosynthesis